MNTVVICDLCSELPGVMDELADGHLVVDSTTGKRSLIPPLVFYVKKRFLG